MGLPALYTEAEAAAYLRITSERLGRIRRAGEIDYVQASAGKVRYTEQHLADYLAQRTRKCRARVVSSDEIVSEMSLPSNSNASSHMQSGSLALALKTFGSAKRVR